MSSDIGKLGGIRRIESVTPHDTNDIEVTRAVLLESSGPLAVIAEDGSSSVVIPNLLGGVWHPLRVTRILDTGTTATAVLVGR